MFPSITYLQAESYNSTDNYGFFFLAVTVVHLPSNSVDTKVSLMIFLVLNFYTFLYFSLEVILQWMQIFKKINFVFKGII